MATFCSGDRSFALCITNLAFLWRDESEFTIFAGKYHVELGEPDVATDRPFGEVRQAFLQQNLTY